MAEDTLYNGSGGKPDTAAKLLLILCVLQPVMDIVSYWLVYFSFGSMISLGIRFVVLTGVTALALAWSDRKKYYWWFIGAAAVFFGLHVLFCRGAFAEYGLAWLMSDAANYLRIIQLPLFTMAFITLLRRAKGGYTAVEKGFFIALCVIFASELISTLTGTDPHTYPNKALGILGWFYFANSQSAILCAAIPVALCWVMKKDRLVFTAIFCVLAFAVLYMFGTRLSYVGIFIIGLGTVITWLLAKKLRLPDAVVIIICVAVCGACVKISPMYINQSRHQEILAAEQADIDDLVRQGKAQYGEDGNEYLRPAYEKYLGGLVDKYGLDRVLERYGSSEDASQIIDVRKMRIQYCSMLMEDSPVGVKLFGLPLESLTHNDYVYDVENDFHGIFYLCGGVGLAATAVFFLYFIVVIIRALIRDWKKYFTPEAGAVGVALITLFIHSYFTAGVLRRPNASFYFSVCLAAAYYLVKINGEGHSVERIQN